MVSVKIPAKSKFVHTDAWRGYYTFDNSVADGNFLAGYGDPYAERQNADEKERIKKIKDVLRKNKISFKFKTTKTSNLFSMGWDILVPPKDMKGAMKKV